ncbi:MAG: YkgJ family cysteine cluster protein [Polyangiaceae bacterium]
MASMLRPVVRSFKVPHAARCADWVRSGGHAIFWETPQKARLVVPVPVPGDESDLALFSLLDLAIDTFAPERTGPFRGLIAAKVPRDCHGIVRRRIERDSGFPGPKHRMKYDCLACGACCKDNDVILEDGDFERFERADMMHLTKPPYARRKEGKLRLVLLPKTKHCQHLHSDNRCGIYEVRPNACRDFPAGSECCIFTREDDLGIFVGVLPGA